MIKSILFIHIYQSIKHNNGLYFESQYDPLTHNDSKTPAEKLQKIEQVKGFFSDHFTKLPKSMDTFGSLSILSINFYKPVLITTEVESNINELIKMIDNQHPTIIALQGITKDEMDILQPYIESEEHYMIVNHDQGIRDMLTGAFTFVPLIIDLRMVNVFRSGYFTTNEIPKQVYASYLLLNDKRLPTSTFSYTVVNVDLFSTFADVISAEFFSIADDIATMKEINERPVLIAGNIATIPIEVKKMMGLSYKNLLTEDSNNNGLKQTTDHTNGNDDGIQRNYLILKDTLGNFKVNYARILTLFEKNNNYPVYAILSFTKSLNAKELNSEHNLDEKDSKGNVIEDKGENKEKKPRKKEGDRKQSSNKLKDGEKKEGDKKEGDKKDGDKKDGEKKDGEKKEGEKKDGEKKGDENNIKNDPNNGSDKSGKDGDKKMSLERKQKSPK